MTCLAAFVALHPLLAVLFVLWARSRSKWIAAPALVIDVLLNYSTAWALWGKPREWTISQRLKRPQKRNQWLADKLKAWLNMHDPGHV